MITEDIVYSRISLGLRQIRTAIIDFYDRCTNKVIRIVLLDEIYPNPVRRNDILQAIQRM